MNKVSTKQCTISSQKITVTEHSAQHKIQKKENAIHNSKAHMHNSTTKLSYYSLLIVKKINRNWGLLDVYWGEGKYRNEVASSAG
jgi:hypothetical protein